MTQEPLFTRTHTRRRNSKTLGIRLVGSGQKQVTRKTDLTVFKCSRYTFPSQLYVGYYGNTSVLIFRFWCCRVFNLNICRPFGVYISEIVEHYSFREPWISVAYPKINWLKLQFMREGSVKLAKPLLMVLVPENKGINIQILGCALGATEMRQVFARSLLSLKGK